jgi:integrase
LNEYKTAATNGQQTTKLPAKFAKLIWAYLESIPQKKYLFTTKNSLDKPFSSAETFGRYVRDTFSARLDKNVSVDILRHSFISWLRKGDLSKAKKLKISREMGHSLEQQENYRKN